MNILLDDLAFNESMYPFASVRSMVHIRIGILTLYEKWQLACPGRIFLTSETEVSDMRKDEMKRVPANIVPSKQFLKELQSSGEEIPTTDTCKVLYYPWQIFEYNNWAIRQDFELITERGKSQTISPYNQLINPENIFIDEGTSINFAILNATDGPIYIGKNVTIEEGSLIKGPFAVCEGSRVKMGTRIYGATTIGPYCLAGGEIKNSVLIGYSNKGHDGYLGDSVVGSWCNLGAGTSNSNLKNTAGMVKMWSRKENTYIDAGNKCGLLMGDYSRSAINTSFNTGTVAGVCCNIFGDTFSSKYIEDFTWGNEKYIFEKAISDINNWKKLKGHEITQEEIKALKNIYQKQ